MAGIGSPAPLDAPLDRGINFQIVVTESPRILKALTAVHWPPFMATEDKWYRRDTINQAPAGSWCRTRMAT